jgi:hypothetical protein
VKPSKSSFCQSTVTYLGYTIGAHGVSTDPSKTETISKYPLPRSKKELQGFLGLCNYYRNFVPHFSSLAAPLYVATEHSQPTTVDWSPLRLESFAALKQSLVQAPILAHPDFAKPFKVQTDASEVGLGAVLSQETVDEQEVSGKPLERVKQHASKKLSPAESRYSAAEREALAVVWACELFRPYLHGQKFILETDNAAVSWMSTSKPTAKLARWALRLQDRL